MASTNRLDDAQLGFLAFRCPTYAGRIRAVRWGEFDFGRQLVRGHLSGCQGFFPQFAGHAMPVFFRSVPRFCRRRDRCLVDAARDRTGCIIGTQDWPNCYGWKDRRQDCSCGAGLPRRLEIHRCAASSMPRDETPAVTRQMYSPGLSGQTGQNWGFPRATDHEQAFSWSACQDGQRGRDQRLGAAIDNGSRVPSPGTLIPEKPRRLSRLGLSRTIRSRCTSAIHAS